MDHLHRCFIVALLLLPVVTNLGDCVSIFFPVYQVSIDLPVNVIDISYRCIEVSVRSFWDATIEFVQWRGIILFSSLMMHVSVDLFILCWRQNMLLVYLWILSSFTVDYTQTHFVIKSYFYVDSISFHDDIVH